MAKNKISEFSATAADNTDITNINIAEGCSPANVNNAIRSLMSLLKNQQDGSSGDPFTVAGTLVASGQVVSSGTLDVTGAFKLDGTAGASGQVMVSAGTGTPTWGTAAASPFGLKNKIINGAMAIDQRNNGAAGTAATNTNPYGVDRWSVYGDVSGKFTYQQNAGAVTPPAGFTNYFGMTSTSAYTVLSGGRQIVVQSTEGFNTYDLDFGKATAKTITLSFWVYSSLTGTFGGSLQNYANTRSYPFTYTISVANTWEYKTVTIAGDTSGTWVGASNAGSFQLNFSLGSGSTYSGTAGAWATANYASATGATSVVGTSGATFYITGVQLEQNTSATPFERRLYGQELANCQRYLPAFTFEASEKFITGQAISTSIVVASLPFPATARAVATGITASAGSNFALAEPNLNYGANQTGTAIAFETGGVNSGTVRVTCTSGLVAGNASTILSRFASTKILFTGCEL